MILVTPSDFETDYSIAQSIAQADTLQSYIDSLVSGETITIRKLLGKTLGDLLIAYIQSTKPTQTVGPLIIGTYYEITTFVAGDDFTNVGASSNASGVRFVATGTLPTVYTNLSVLTTLVKRYEDIVLPFYEDVDSCCEWWDMSTCLNRIANSHGIKNLLTIQIYYSYLFGEQVIHSQSGVASQSVENGKIQSPQNALRKGEQKWNEGGLDTWYAIHWFCKYKYPEIYPEFKGIMEIARSSSII